MPRRRSSVLSAIEAFNNAYDTTSRVRRDYKIRDIMDAKPEEVQSFSDEDVKRLNEAADSGKYDVGIKMGDDGNFEAYTLTPKLAATQSEPAMPAQAAEPQVAMRKRTEFLGQSYDKPLTEGQQDLARSKALSNVIAEKDPAQALAMRSAARREERQARLDQEEDAYKEGRKQVFGQTSVGQAYTEQSGALRKYAQDAAEYKKKIDGGMTVDQAGPPPQPPAMRMPTYIDTLNQVAHLSAYDISQGRGNPELMLRLGKEMSDVRKSGAIDAMKMLNGGNLEGGIAKWNEIAGAIGEKPIDPRSVVSYDEGKANLGGVEVPTRILKVRGPDGQIVSINAAQQLDAFDNADKVVTRAIQGKQEARAEKADVRADKADVRADASLRLQQNADRRAAGAEARANTTFSQGQRDRNDKQAAAVALAKELGLSDAQVEAVRAGVMKLPTDEGGEKKITDPTKMRKAFSEPKLDDRGRPVVNPVTQEPVYVVNEKRMAEYIAFRSANKITDDNKGINRFEREQWIMRDMQGRPEVRAIQNDPKLDAKAKEDALRKYKAEHY